ncbi:MAG TPA: [FeFe] hydrogenase H-cluster radical SAM maturase HydE [Anaerohalosphaeraceae bacterium]|nr:[FeFe] hydrogenase H-cluster radical SAM maturase HydE [Anaerohalosphaeraceae bacterium]HQG06103.1 [FeFe] hydrogenase H-cluster radical SAM maturase HydE [Anaerohalosphaeraceae bacterium]HQI06547.1 [FeFe] hydrogenase H-cluster radical SAM maturase HydE [Anaerohalosphaeraceae bacterium]HQJ67988.1 [FeFe] hydrogenase H-cluster radical SAM maturase HydE [Anaerohalosphaeraceae bacterium]
MLSRTEIETWLQQTDPDALETLWRMADRVRKEYVGDAVHLRGLLEISNHCARTCAYCGLSRHNKHLRRYRMTADEILECIRQIADFGYGTVVLQAGEDDGIQTEWLAQIIRTVKQTTPLAVTLSLGERPFEDLRCWRQAGADRYLLRFETSDPALYSLIHPPRPGRTAHRLEILSRLRQLGYEVGSGIMVGIPGQTFPSLADDIELFRRLDLDMIGLGPYIPHPHTPLGTGQITPTIHPSEQVPNTEQMTCKVIALTRLVCPEANIPSTTALAAVNPKTGRLLGLQRGANVVMPNCTPARYRRLYEIYPGKTTLSETALACRHSLEESLRSIGRTLAVGPGPRRRRINPPQSEETATRP